jgi:signal transduction histidine kinase/CheY-like chemotaxis protein
MTLRNKILFLITGCFIVFMGALLTFREIQSHQNKLIIESAIEQQEVIAGNALNSKSDQLRQLVMDYSNWDDIIYYLDHKDYKWANDNIASIINSFELYSVGAFKLDHELVYSFGQNPLKMMGDTAQQSFIFKTLQEKGSIKYYRRLNEGVLEVTAAVIHPTIDTARRQLGRGYFFASKLWNTQYLGWLATTTQSKIQIENADFEVSNSMDDDSIHTTIILNDYQQKALCTVAFHKPYKFIGIYHKTSDFVLYFLAILLLLVLSIFFFILFRWVRRPLNIISETLRRGDTYQLGVLQKKEDEFNQIAGMIVKFNQQRKQLELENAERKLIQQQLVQQSTLLQGLADASNRLLTIDNLDEAIEKALKSIAEKSTVDRIFIFKNVYDTVNESIKTQRVYEWIQPDLDLSVDQDECREIYFSRESDSLLYKLQEGETIKGNSIDFKEDLKSLCDRQKIKSLIIVPVLDPKEHTLWGFTGFADCTSGHQWDTSEETLLGMLANNIGGAIRRYMSQQELKETMELARSADRAKSNFLASMSHEIRTPMNGVIGMTSLLLQSDLSPAQREYVETIESSGDSLLNIINEILDFSKIESGHMVLEESPFDLRGCIEDVLDLMAPKIFEKRLEIIYYLDPQIQPYIFGDGFRLRQILVNLIGNAIKFTEKGEILVQVMLDKKEDDSVFLEFSVKDTGIGIPADKIHALFSPFTQVDASTTRKYGGSGLGLAISANLVELMEGKIWVSSELGIGSDFRFTIKTYFTTPPENANLTIDKLRLLPGKKVLIVDDNATNRRILQLQFEYWNIESVAVESGAQAIELLDRKMKFDSCILDMQMPHMDGEMLAREIRRRYTKLQLPLIMLTSIGFNVRTPEVQQLFSYYVNKPVKHSRLAEILLSVFSEVQDHVDFKEESEFDLQSISQDYPFKILIAEDNFINQKLIRNLFEVLGYKTDLVANGHEAIDALKRKKYNIIFMDVQMPEMDGYEATRKIKERWVVDGPVIIAMTANAMQGDKEKCIVSGMDDYISKPLRLEDLVKVLRYWGEIRLISSINTN